jgi:hypothetical protein
MRNKWPTDLIAHNLGTMMVFAHATEIGLHDDVMLFLVELTHNP